MGFTEFLIVGLGGIAGYLVFTKLINAQLASRSRKFISPTFALLVVACASSGYVVWTDPTNRFAIGIFFISAAIIAVCLHEFGHAIAALRGGDNEVVSKGYLSLDPLKYSDPILSIVMPALFMFIGGLPLPGGAVYINEAALRGDFWRIVVSASGVIANLLTVLLIALLFVRFGDSGPATFWSVVAFFTLIQIAVVLLNLLPIPPLDGFGILTPLLPTSLRNVAEHYRLTLGFLPLLIFLIPNPLISAIWEYSRELIIKTGFSLRMVSDGRELVFSLFPKFNS